MKPDEIKEMLTTLTDSKSMSEASEEQEMGTDLFQTTIKALSPLTLSRWLYNKEWEDALVPVRLPKGTSELLKLMDETRVEHTTFERCGDCKKKVGCPLLERNPSELLLTYLVKLAFTEMVTGKGPPK